MIDKQMDRQIDQQIDRETDKEIDRQVIMLEIYTNYVNNVRILKINRRR